MEPQAQRASDYLKRIGTLVDARMADHLPADTLRPERIHSAMRYSMFAGGKRLRPGLCYAAFEAFGGKGDNVFLATSALEMLHTFSLIHDDLPCMDDDDFRRGRPTCHRQYDEATAVLAGDALCIHAFELLAQTGNAAVVATVARSLGTQGMIGGQMVDIESENKQVDLQTVDYIHYHKTGALLQASLLVGAQLAGASASDQQILSDYGRSIGLAFQVIDDILDVEGTTEQLGKDAGSDLEKGKATYPALVGLEASKEKARELCDQAIQQLRKLSCDTTILEDIARFVIHRVN